MKLVLVGRRIVYSCVIACTSWAASLENVCTKAFSLTSISLDFFSSNGPLQILVQKQQVAVILNDLRDLDEGLYQGLLKLKNYPGNVEDFSLDFTITDQIPNGMPDGRAKVITRDLMPNGSNIPVTNENRLLYIAYVVRHRLHIQPYELTQAFLRGLGQIINPSWLSMFNQVELQTLISGETSDININDLRKNTQYGGVYQIGYDGREHPTIRMFWQVMEEFKDEDRRKVLKYVTSTPRAPLLGFASLNPQFSIRDSSSDEDRLPSASTCVNLLKLPRYQSKEKLREKLLYAVNAGAGFDLS
ncbi:HECT-domain-containing protein [Botrytis cinerea]